MFWQDLRYGARMLLKNPGFTLIAVLTLALGIGANTAIFSVVNGVLLRPLPFDRAERLVRVYATAADRGIRRYPTSWLNFADWRAQNGVFDAMAAYSGASVTFTGGAATIFTLFKAGGKWSIVGEASSGAEYGTRQVRFNPQTVEAEVLRVLDVYYTAVDEGDPDAISRIFDSGWHMKNHEGGAIVSEDKATFVARIESGTFEGYASDRQIADVQIVSERMACVRIDKPSRSVVTVFIFFRLGGEWVVVDKAFSSLHK